MTNLPQHEGLAGLALFLIAVSFVLPAVKSTHGEMSAIDLVVNGTASTYKGKEKGSHAQRIESLDFRLTGGAANFLAALAFYAFFQAQVFDIDLAGRICHSPRHAFDLEPPGDE